MSATASSIQSQLPSIPRRRLLHPQSEDAPYHGDRDPLNMGSFIRTRKLMLRTSSLRVTSCIIITAFGFYLLKTARGIMMNEKHQDYRTVSCPHPKCDRQCCGKVVLLRNSHCIMVFCTILCKTSLGHCNHPIFFMNIDNGVTKTR
jgi:hypothetical protein